MSHFQIGVMVDSFRLSLVEGVKKAYEVGASGIQIYATNGQMAPENLSPAARKEILDMIRSNGLVVSALCGDLGGHGFAKEEDNIWKIEKSKRIMDLARDFDTTVVTTHIGVIPEKLSHPVRSTLQAACEQLGQYGDQVGAFFAIETGPEKALTLKLFLDSLSSHGVRVNYDPANLVMLIGDDPVQGVYTLKDYIVHTHAKDGIMKKKSNPEQIYDQSTESEIEERNLDVYYEETPLGKGQVDFTAYLNALHDIGYKGFLTIEREVGNQPEIDIQEAVYFLKAKMGSK